MHLFNELCSAGRPSCMAKTLMLDIMKNICTEFFHTCCACRQQSRLPFYTTFSDFTLTGVQGLCKAKPHGFIFLHTFHLCFFIAAVSQVTQCLPSWQSACPLEIRGHIEIVVPPGLIACLLSRWAIVSCVKIKGLYWLLALTQ